MAKRRRQQSEEPEVVPKKRKTAVLTFKKLAAFDDLLTDVKVDKAFFWTTSRKMAKGRQTSVRGCDENEVSAIIKNHLIYHTDLDTAKEKVLNLKPVRDLYGRLDSDDKMHFGTHLRQYMLIYLPDCPWEIDTTHRYTFAYEAKVTARVPISSGEVIRYLTGTLVDITAEEEEELKKTKSDFSIVTSSRSRKISNRVFLGPARFANHDCNANARLDPHGKDSMRVIAKKPIDVGDEITVTYGDNYFGEDNCECLCASCEVAQRGVWAPRESSEETGGEDEADEPQQPRTRRAQRSMTLSAKLATKHRNAIEEKLCDAPKLPISPAPTVTSGDASPPYNFRRPRKSDSISSTSSDSSASSADSVDSCELAYGVRDQRAIRAEELAKEKAARSTWAQTNKCAAKLKKRVDKESARKRRQSGDQSSGRPTKRTRQSTYGGDLQDSSSSSPVPTIFSDDHLSNTTNPSPPVDYPVPQPEVDKSQRQPLTLQTLETAGVHGRPQDHQKLRSQYLSTKKTSTYSRSSTGSATTVVDRLFTRAPLQQTRVGSNKFARTHPVETYRIESTTETTARLSARRQPAPDIGEMIVTSKTITRSTGRQRRNKTPEQSEIIVQSIEISKKTTESPSSPATPNQRSKDDWRRSSKCLVHRTDSWVECQMCSEDFVQSLQTNKQTLAWCPRCDRHFKLYGFKWPKRQQEDRHDDEKRVTDHRTVHRFLLADEAKQARYPRNGRPRSTADTAEQSDEDEAPKRAGLRRRRTVIRRRTYESD